MYGGILVLQVTVGAAAALTMFLRSESACLMLSIIAVMVWATWNMVKPFVPCNPSEREVRRMELCDELWDLLGELQDMNGMALPGRAQIEARIAEIKADEDFAYESFD